jgi:hypothetical protein
MAEIRVAERDQPQRPPSNTVALGAGFGIGILWVLIAGRHLLSSMRAYANDRFDWGLGFLLVGGLLMAAGIAAMVATWWHLTRVMADRHV